MTTLSCHDVACDLRSLSNLDLIHRTAELAENERATTIQLLHHLGEIERRKLFLDMGYSSLFAYCTGALHYSSPSACRRIKAGRCIREFPRVLDLLETGEMDLGTVFLIEPVLTEENGEVLLKRVRERSYRAVKRVVAEYGPPVVDTGDRFEPVRVRVTPSDVDGFLFERELARGGHYPRTPGAESVVVSVQKTCVTFLASDDLMEKFEQVKALLSNRNADATFAEVLEVLLDEYMERHSPHARQKRREARKAAAAPSTTGGKSSTVGADGNFPGSPGSEPQPSRHVPASVRDQVFMRDQGRCTFIAPNGTRCGATRGIQIDHIRPYGAEGTHDPDNLRLLCAGHNRLAAEQTLGSHVMERYWPRQ